jgi:MFS family permease
VFVLRRGPLSDWLGRRTAFLAATLLFLATSIPCILAPNIYLLIAFRALQGLAVAAYGALADAVLLLCCMRCMAHTASMPGACISSKGASG